MATRTIRLDEEAESALRQIRQATGLQVSEAVTRGLRALEPDLAGKKDQMPYEVYRRLDLGPGGYTALPSTETRRGVTEAVRKKLRR
jgi:hypothetical protein